MSKRRAAFLAMIITLSSSLAFRQVFISEVSPTQAQAGQPTPVPSPTPEPKNPHTNTSNCLNCHSNSSMVGRFSDGTQISLFYDLEAHPATNHGQRCAACHEAEQSYPHQNTLQTSCSICHWEKSGNTAPDTLEFKLTYPDARTISLEISDACKKCHKEKFAESADSIHLKMLAEGNRFAPVCVDCHSSHDIDPGNTTREMIAKVCSECHLAVYTSYQSSVHGAALEQESNPDVPTCGDCHGVHNVHGPDDAGFRADSITTCGNCHSDPTRMEKYDISTNVLTTYLDDFHGRTVEYSRQANSPQVTKATCYDCHGIHNIRSPKDENSTVYPTHIQETCQRCHPDADSTFPQAWLSHSVPNWEETPILYGVNLVYQGMIPALIGAFILYILLDARRRIAVNIKSRRVH